MHSLKLSYLRSMMIESFCVKDHFMCGNFFHRITFMISCFSVNIYVNINSAFGECIQARNNDGRDLAHEFLYNVNDLKID